MEYELIELQKFNEGDYSQLIAEVPDARFLLQWAGPRYIYPLDTAQLNETLAKSLGEKPSFQVFKAVQLDISASVGHIQLMDIDYNASNCILGRVMIFQNYRGNGFGKAMVQEAVKIAFLDLNLEEIILGVFDFNQPAINIYQSIGFSEFQFKKGARQFKDESWNVVRMKLNKYSWLHDKNANNGIE